MLKRIVSRNAWLLAIALVAAPLTAVAQTAAAQTDGQDAAPEAPAKLVDALFARWSATDSPGCAVAVVHDGRIVHRRGYGMANLDLDVANRPSTVFNIASMSKQFTAASLVLLAKAGKLTLDDDVRKYVPELPRYERPITIRHLLQHTSGIRDFIDLMAIGGRPLDSVYSLEQTLELITRQRALNFPPGDRYLYSNSGYILLLAIVERVSGETFGRYVEKNIFQPLGMTHSRVYDDRAMIVKDRATGYFTRADGRLGGRMSAWQIPGDGGVLTTVEDLALWDRAFYEPAPGSAIDADLIAQLTTPGRLHDGSPIEYGLGLRVETYRGLRLISHSGGIGGFGTQMLRFPERRFTAICLCNTGDANPTALARRIADIYLFHNTPGPAQPAAPTANAGAPASTASGASAPAAAPSIDLSAYAGEYWSADVETALTVRWRDGRLWIERRYAEPMALSPVASGDRGASGERGNASGERATGGAVFSASRFTVTFAAAPKGTDLFISTGRAKDVRFTRRPSATPATPAATESRPR